MCYELIIVASFIAIGCLICYIENKKSSEKDAKIAKEKRLEKIKNEIHEIEQKQELIISLYDEAASKDFCGIGVLLIEKESGKDEKNE